MMSCLWCCFLISSWYLCLFFKMKLTNILTKSQTDMQYIALLLLNIDVPNASPHSSSLWKSLEKKQVEVILEKIMYLKSFACFLKNDLPINLILLVSETVGLSNFHIKWAFEYLCRSKAQNGNGLTCANFISCASDCERGNKRRSDSVNFSQLLKLSSLLCLLVLF